MISSSIQGSIFHLTFEFLQLLIQFFAGVAVVPAAMAAVFVFLGCLMFGVMNTYAVLPVACMQAKKGTAININGKEYQRGLSGMGVFMLRHAYRKLVIAFAELSGCLLSTVGLCRVSGSGSRVELPTYKPFGLLASPIFSTAARGLLERKLSLVRKTFAG